MQNIVVQYDLLETLPDIYTIWGNLSDGIISIHVGQGSKIEGNPAQDLFPVAIDLDDLGYIRSIEIWYSIFAWDLSDNLYPPSHITYAKLKFSIKDETVVDIIPQCYVDTRFSCLYFEWYKGIKTEKLNLSIGNGVVFELSEHGKVCGLWILDLPFAIRNYLRFNSDKL